MKTLLALIFLFAAPLGATEAPTLALPQVAAHSVTITWLASTSPADSYSVYRSTGAGVTPTLLQSVIVPLTYTDTAVVAGGSYNYAVTAVCLQTNATCKGESLLSNIVTATVPGAVVTNSNFTMSVTPTSLKFSGIAGAAVAAQSLTINDTTPTALPIAMTVDQPWIVLKCTSTTNSCLTTKAVESVTVNSTGMAAGTYTGHIIATESAPETNGDAVNNSPLSIPITLTVTGPTPTLTLNCPAAKAGITTNLPAGTSYSMTVTAGGLSATCGASF